MTAHKTLTAAMDAGDELAEAEIRYALLAEAFEELPQLRSNLAPALERAKTEILRLRAAAKKPKNTKAVDNSKVVAFDAGRFRKSGTSTA
ncbi:hypothetical protein [Tsukamurella tyrosinosolvens]|uniref:hypothetical protein n=1 Tax=Tsukamurella tyrosinosolvens TaxID=57704 RepID=UPI0034627719